MKKLFPVFIIFNLLSLSPLYSADYWVDINHSQASDDNPGTKESPWKTIQHSVNTNTVKPGDTVHIMPGRYRESVVMKGQSNPNVKPGKPVKPPAAITFIADGNGPAIIDGTVQLSASDFQPSPIKGVFTWKPLEPLADYGAGAKPQPMAWVFADDQRLLLRQGALLETNVMCFAREREQISVNFNGKDIPEKARMEVSLRMWGFNLVNMENIHIKGIEFYRQAGQAVNLSYCQNCLFEDCNIIEPNMHGIATGGSENCVFRRVRIFGANMWAANFFGQGHTIEECVFQTGGYRLDPAGEAWIGNLKFNGGSFLTVRHNLVIDRPPSKWKLGTIEVDNDGKWPFGGIWGDCDCMDNRIYGNVIVRMAHAGIYVEHKQNRNIIMYNTIQDCAMGITLRQASGNIVRRNWVFDSEALGIGTVDTDNFAGLGPWKTQPDSPHWGREILDGICLWHTFMDPPTADNIVMDNLVQVSGRLISIPVPGDQDERAMKDAARIMGIDDFLSLKDKIAVRGGGYKEAAGSYRSPLNNVLNHNYYAIKPNPKRPGFAWYLDKQIETFEEFQKLTGFEENGRVGAFNPSDIGLRICWTIPDGTRYPDRPVAFDYDGGAERGAFPTGHKAGFFVDNVVQPYSWYRTTGKLIDGDCGKIAKDDPAVWTQWPACHSGIHGLGVVNTNDAAKIAAEGAGWRTLSVPVKPGTVMDISLYVKLVDVKPADKSGGAVEIYACFSDWTGHNLSREYLVGRDANQALGRGTRDWTKVDKKIKVPEEARRMTVYAGMGPGTGTLLIDDLDMNMEVR